MIENIKVILVNWNLKIDTQECIDSLLRAGLSLSEIILVDNHSDDDSVNFLRNSYGESLLILETEANIGFAGGANLGINYALENQAKWIFLLNNDTIISEELFNNLEKALVDHREYEIFGPLICYYDHPGKIWYLGDKLIAGLPLTTNPYRGKTQIKERGITDIDFISGCAFLASAEVYKKVGLLNENFFMYGEEIDWCWRARKKGYRFAGVPTVTMWHKISASSKAAPASIYYRVRNQIWLYKKYSTHLQVIVVFVFTFFKTIMMMVTSILKRINLRELSSLYHAWVDGWFHYPKDKFGE